MAMLVYQMVLGPHSWNPETLRHTEMLMIEISPAETWQKKLSELLPGGSWFW